MEIKNFVFPTLIPIGVFSIFLFFTNPLKSINASGKKAVLENNNYPENYCADSVQSNRHDEANDYDLPEWCDSHRVQAHTRLRPQYITENPDLFFGAAGLLKKVGVVTFTRHIKTGGEGAWWPSKVGAVLPIVEEGRNVAKEIIDNTHKEDMYIIAYHRHMEDDYMAKQNPDWVCKNPEGEFAEKRRGWMMCFNSPYQDYFLTRALELEDLGADGFYFDEVHMPKEGCWCNDCTTKFKKETGLTPPAKFDVQDSRWWEYHDFMNRTIERTFRRYSKEFLKKNPKLVTLVASNTWPLLNDPQTTSSLYHIPGVINKTEFIKGGGDHKQIGIIKQPENSRTIPKYVGQVAGYAVCRDAADGRPAHVWANNLCNEPARLAATALIVGHGDIANLDMEENKIPDHEFASSLAIGEKISKYYANAKPLRYLAIHFSEHARDAYWNDYEAAWKKVLHPLYGVYQTMLEKRLPVSFITDCQLEEGLLNDYKVLFITDKSKLTPAMEKSIVSFQNAGGKVIYNNQKWEWDNQAGYEDARKSFFSTLQDTKVPPITVTGGPDNMQTDFFWNSRKKRLTVSCINDCSWVELCKRVKDITTQKPPEPISGVTVELQDRSGNLSKPPSRIIEAVSGRELKFRKINNKIYINVPEFQYLATVVVQY